MENKIGIFVKGSFGSGLPFAVWIFGSVGIDINFAYTFFLKLFATIIFAFFGGLATVAANDFGKHLKQKWNARKKTKTKTGRSRTSGAG